MQYFDVLTFGGMERGEAILLSIRWYPSVVERAARLSVVK